MLSMLILRTCAAVKALERESPLRDLRYIVLTHLTPKRISSIKEVLQRRQTALFGAGPLEIFLSNPALQLLRSALGMYRFCQDSPHASAWCSSC